jgi:hypothetical protein
VPPNAGCADLSSLLAPAPQLAPPSHRRHAGCPLDPSPGPNAAPWAIGALAPCILHSLHDLLQASSSMEQTCLPGSIQASEVTRRRLPDHDGWLPFGVGLSDSFSVTHIQVHACCSTHTPKCDYARAQSCLSPSPSEPFFPPSSLNPVAQSIEVPGSSASSIQTFILEPDEVALPPTCALPSALPGLPLPQQGNAEAFRDGRLGRTGSLSGCHSKAMSR